MLEELRKNIEEFLKRSIEVIERAKKIKEELEQEKIKK